MEIGDLVRVIDRSYAQRVDNYERVTSSISTEETYEVVEFVNYDHLTTLRDIVVHDVIIKSTMNGRIYLHSGKFLKAIKPKTKRLTLSEIEKHYGCKVVIVG